MELLQSQLSGEAPAGQAQVAGPSWLLTVGLPGGPERSRAAVAVGEGGAPAAQASAKSTWERVTGLGLRVEGSQEDTDGRDCGDARVQSRGAAAVGQGLGRTDESWAAPGLWTSAQQVRKAVAALPSRLGIRGTGPLPTQPPGADPPAPLLHPGYPSPVVHPRVGTLRLGQGYGAAEPQQGGSVRQRKGTCHHPTSHPCAAGCG